MNLQHVGAGCIALGILLFVAALAQPATVTDTSRTCIDSTWSYGQDCSTVEYQAPNPARSQLFGAGVFTTFFGVVVYVVGASRSGGGRASGPPPSPARSSRSPDGSDGGSGGHERATARRRDDDATTLRAQLDARTGDRRGSATDSPQARTTANAPAGPTDGAPTDATADAAAAGTSGPAVEPTPTSATDDGRLTVGAGAAVSSLASAYVLSWLLGLVATVETGLVRILAFAALALPGVALYSRYRTADAAGETDGTAARDATDDADLEGASGPTDATGTEESG